MSVPLSSFSAIWKLCLREAAFCLNAGADPNGLSTEGAAAMHIAAGIGVEAVRLLLLHGGDPNVR